MRTLDQWQALGIVCGALLALLTLVSVIYRRAARPMWRAAKTFVRLAEQLVGDNENGVPSLMDRIQSLDENQQRFNEQQTALGQRLTDHLEWHGNTSGEPVRPGLPRPAGGQSARRSREARP